ncbi:MAG: hypothetical protein LBF40_00605 [Deltaproteobacteria bacterium]|jgi:hypothetical protein|nr:hypothetical protein [Deltaproteobacteria bacterium]
MKSLPMLLLLCALLFSLFNAPLFAQEPSSLLKLANQEAFFCGYEPSDTQGVPDGVIIAKDGKEYALCLGAVTKDELTILKSLKPNVPISYDLSIHNYSGEGLQYEYVTDIFITKFKVMGDPKPNSCPQ